MPKPSLVFVYNADAGIFNALADLAHKTLSPDTYSCNLCALTYGVFGMRGQWKDFLQNLNRPAEFLHADELRRSYDITGVRLPAVFERDGDTMRVLIGEDEIAACRTLAELQELMSKHVN